MDRIFAYAGAIPQATDLLYTNLNAMLAVGNLADAVMQLNSSVITSGLVLSPTSPASLTMQVGPGSIYQREEVDATAYGALGSNTTQFVVKQGINLAPTSFTLTPPSTAGYSQIFLIQANLLESDIDPTTFNYYNSTPPYTPFVGPGGSGATQNQFRSCVVSLQLVSGGTLYPTGTDPSLVSGAVPPVSSGWVGLYLISVANGQTAISYGIIYPGAPLLPQPLTKQRIKLYSALTIPVSATGSDSWPAPSSFTPFATLQNAWNYINNTLDLNGQTVTISVGAGTFAPVRCSGQPLGGVGVNIVGAGSSTIISATANNVSAVAVDSGAVVSVSNLTVQASGTAGSGLSVSGGTLFDAGGIVYGACTQAHRNAYGASANLVVTGNSTVTGAAAQHLYETNGGSIYFNVGTTTTGSGALAFTTFAQSSVGQINTNNHTWSGMGSFTGQQFNVSYGGAIITGTAGSTTYFPGSTAGTYNTGTSYAGFYH